MSMFENKQYRWRETYFVLFKSSNRPTLDAVKHVLSALDESYKISNLNADDSGLCESLTLLSPDDFSALDISYIEGAEVLEHAAELVEEMKPAACSGTEKAGWSQIKQCDGRFDVLHFEQVSEFPEDDYGEETLDPSALILVLGALARLTGGVAVDPQAGTMLEDDE